MNLVSTKNLSRMNKPRILRLRKKGGGYREIEIPDAPTKRLQREVHRILEPVFEPRFQSFSYGFRKGMGPLRAVDGFQGNVEEGFQWVASIDVKDCFPSIYPVKTLRLIDSRIDGIKGMTGRSGLPQGHPISPFLSNVYLDQFDRKVGPWRTPHKQGGLQTVCRVVRYVDNIWLMCRSRKELECYLSLASRILTDLGLSFRSQIGHVNQGIDILGFVMTKRSIGPRHEAIERLKNRSIEIALRDLEMRYSLNSVSSAAPLPPRQDLPLSIQGWKSYFRSPTSTRLDRLPSGTHPHLGRPAIYPLSASSYEGKTGAGLAEQFQGPTFTDTIQTRDNCVACGSRAKIPECNLSNDGGVT
jgi:RNA-directed DNA polymerase